MHTIKVIAIVIASCLLLGGVFLLWDKHAHSMGVAKSFYVGDASLPQHVLIATQDSPFKDALVDGVIGYLRPRAIYVEVIDVSALPSVHENDWTAIIVTHTWELGKPQTDAKLFVDRIRDKKKLIVVTTSGGGREKIPGVDVISTASVMDNVPARVAEVTARLNALLPQNASP